MRRGEGNELPSLFFPSRFSLRYASYNHKPQLRSSVYPSSSLLPRRQASNNKIREHGFLRAVNDYARVEGQERKVENLDTTTASPLYPTRHLPTSRVRRQKDP